jgi:hypothetical protein
MLTLSAGLFNMAVGGRWPAFGNIHYGGPEFMLHFPIAQTGPTPGDSSVLSA